MIIIIEENRSIEEIKKDLKVFQQWLRNEMRKLNERRMV